LIEERYNVKPGDMILTDIGTGLLTKETRAYWFYLFKNRISRIKKSHFWQMIDCGTIEIKYAENKKYRRIQKRYRTLDTRDIMIDNLEEDLDDFIHFVTLPCSVVFGPNSECKIKTVIRKLDELSLDYYEEKGYSTDIKPVIRIMK
jgi:hypothetical protein